MTHSAQADASLSPHRATRQPGLDIARGWAVVGMVFINYKVVLSQGTPISNNWQRWLDLGIEAMVGHSAATFLVIGGYGLALQIERDGGMLTPVRRDRLIKRNLFLFVVGLLYMLIWSGDILHYIGLFNLLLLPFLAARRTLLAALAVLVALTTPVLQSALPYDQGWDFATLEYTGFWTLRGFLFHTFVNGFHPVFPWIIFPIAGLCLGRSPSPLRSPSVCAGVAAVVASFAIVVHLAVRRLAQKLGEEIYLLTLQSMPPSTLYVISGIAVATLIMSLCYLAAQKDRLRRLLLPFELLGRLALSAYIAHVVVGLGLLFVLGRGQAQSIAFCCVYATLFLGMFAVFAWLWLRHFRQGPLEWLLRFLSGGSDT